MKKATETVSQPKATSVSNQYDLLAKVVQQPDEIDEALRQSLLVALATQGTLAAFDHLELGIVGMSLNTHKTVADQTIKGGYNALNDYRKAALARLKDLREVQSRPGRGTLDWYKSELAIKTQSLERITNDVALMSKRLDEVMDLAYQMAADSGRLDEFQKRSGELMRKFK